MTEDGSWLSVADAARTLGVSVDTVRRMLKRGQLQGRSEPTARGYRWLVSLDGAASAAQGSAAPAASAAHPSAGPDTALLAELRDEIAAMAAREERMAGQLAEAARALEREQVASAELRILLQRALERQPMLELQAPADTVAAHTEAPPEPKPRRRWWHALVWG